MNMTHLMKICFCPTKLLGLSPKPDGNLGDWTQLSMPTSRSSPSKSSLTPVAASSTSADISNNSNNKNASDQKQTRSRRGSMITQPVFDPIAEASFSYLYGLPSYTATETSSVASLSAASIPVASNPARNSDSLCTSSTSSTSAAAATSTASAVANVATPRFLTASAARGVHSVLDSIRKALHTPKQSSKM
ncbi:UNVERIFIED_CONTAM: hypothetical protein HDU68_012144 [Siphonaria sp. JEL0065]|nr:hypothetical protein HDU68_012144 [Siphonaria sp. JEL0065]